ncbi:MAG: sigma-54 dependent transcriptional regulator [Oxalicibacterium faecigallinarum]|uniref:sigma-54-dependent transcriptional regulator n=1 Tax=Oxalicibacterium faecigallinarum TaxID=573741 RepID=UPI00280860D8|nr:sigma-54 dependent transcriptional regulator [Oxalicibacterium faecigallinarum]MDQ7970558.1 sigma-54 dependent transcriptional regulator [Oxalicibacterium faecigallinarum]
MSTPRILIVDDEADLRELLEITLIRMGLDVDSADTLTAARGYLQQQKYALVLTDMRLPDGQGIDLVCEIAAMEKSPPVAVITAFGSADNAVAALKAGAFDYLSKPVGLEQLRTMVRTALRISEKAPAMAGNARARTSIPLRLMGESEVMQALRAQIAKLARSMAPVAISGESGSGKELAARDIHAQSARSDKPFIAVNCGAIPEALMEAEFFGYRKGAFTGASEDRDGFFQAAHGGTLLLDEVADLPLAMQVKLLRAIQERRVRKVGATTEEPVDVRIISATHQNLHACVQKGSFRQDLYYRLNVIELSLPPLRERLADIGLLSEAILARLSPGTPASLAPGALAALRSYRFPGNVRELENILERALAFANNGKIEQEDLLLKASETSVLQDVLSATPLPAQNTVARQEAAAITSGLSDGTPKDQGAEMALPGSLPDHLDQIERDVIRRALAKTHFNRTQAAELLGISFRQLRYRMQRLNIHEPE